MFGTYKMSDEKIWADGGVSVELRGGKNRWQGWVWVNIETGEVIWMDEEDIRKRESTSIFGR